MTHRQENYLRAIAERKLAKDLREGKRYAIRKNAQNKNIESLSDEAGLLSFDKTFEEES